MSALRNISPRVKQRGQEFEKKWKGQTDAQLAYKQRYWRDDLGRSHLRDEILPLEQVRRLPYTPGRDARPIKLFEQDARGLTHEAQDRGISPQSPAAGIVEQQQSSSPTDHGASSSQDQEGESVAPFHDDAETQRRLARRLAEIEDRHLDEVDMVEQSWELLDLDRHVSESLGASLRESLANAYQHRQGEEAQNRLLASQFTRLYKAKFHGERVMLEDIRFREGKYKFTPIAPSSSDSSNDSTYSETSFGADLKQSLFGGPHEMEDPGQQEGEDAGPEHGIAEAYEDVPNPSGQEASSRNRPLGEAVGDRQTVKESKKDKGKQRAVSPEPAVGRGHIESSNFMSRKLRQVEIEANEVGEDSSDEEQGDVKEAMRRSIADQAARLKNPRNDSSGSGSGSAVDGIRTDSSASASASGNNGEPAERRDRQDTFASIGRDTDARKDMVADTDDSEQGM